MVAKWYIINVLSGYEKKVIGLIKENALKKHVADAFKDFVIPMIELSRIKKDKRVFGVMGDNRRNNSRKERLIVNSIRSGRKEKVLLAGILSLMLGTFLAFFMEFLEKSKKA